MPCQSGIACCHGLAVAVLALFHTVRNRYALFFQVINAAGKPGNAQIVKRLSRADTAKIAHVLHNPVTL